MLELLFILTLNDKKEVKPPVIENKVNTLNTIDYGLYDCFARPNGKFILQCKDQVKFEDPRNLIIGH